MALNRELVKGSTETIILCLLADGPQYGYQIAREVDQRTNGALRLREGSLYPMLHSLEHKGLLRATWRPSERGPARRYYRLTAKGRRAVNARVAEWRQFSRAMNAAIAGASDG